MTERGNTNPTIVKIGGKYENLELVPTLEMFPQKIIMLFDCSVVIVSEIDEHGFNDEDGIYHGWDEIKEESSLHEYLECKKRHWVGKE